MCSLHDQQRPRGEQQHRDEHRVLSNSEQTECSVQYYKVLLSEYRFSLLQTLKRARENKSMFFYYLENKSFQLKHTANKKMYTIWLISLVITKK